MKIPKQNFLDKAISFVSPERGVSRLKSKTTLAYVNSAGGYDQPGSPSKKFLRPFDVDQNSPDYDTLEKQGGSIALSRDQYMNNPLATGMLKRVKTTTVGTGLKVQSQIDSEFLGMKNDQARKWQKNTERKFRTWAESKDCDITRQQNFYELQDLVFFSVLLSGDVFTLFPLKKIDTLSSPVRVRLIESDLCSTPNFKNVDLSKSVFSGVEVDKDGAPKNYYFTKQYPGNNLDVMLEENWVTVPAFSKSNKRQVHHLYFKERPGQRRGMPLLSNMINDLVKVTKLKDAELTAHVISSLFTVFVKDQSGFADPLQEGFDQGTGGFETNDAKAKVDPNDSTKTGLGTGSVVYLDDKKDITIADSRKMNEAFDGFYNSFVKELGASIDIPFEQLIMHFSSSYSASRGALLEAWKTVRVRRAWLAVNFCQPAYQIWLDEQVASRKILAPGYFENTEIRSAWSKTSWSGMGNGQLDPLKETKASVMKINNNLSSHENEYNQINDDADWEGTVYRRKAEDELITELDLQPVAKTNALTMADEEEVEEPETKEEIDE